MSRETHYEALGVDRGSTPDEVKAAWKRRASETHPDKGGSADEFDECRGAYEILGDAKRRTLYDTLLLARGNRCERCGGAGRTHKQLGPLRRESTPCPKCNGNGVVIFGREE